jgi:hypothetical protein
MANVNGWLLHDQGWSLFCATRTNKPDVPFVTLYKVGEAQGGETMNHTLLDPRPPAPTHRCCPCAAVCVVPQAAHPPEAPPLNESNRRRWRAQPLPAPSSKSHSAPVSSLSSLPPPRSKVQPIKGTDQRHRLTESVPSSSVAVHDLPEDSSALIGFLSPSTVVTGQTTIRGSMSLD